MPGGVAGGEEVGELVVFQAPAGAHQKIVGALRDEAVNGYVVAQTVYYIAAQIHVFLHRETLHGNFAAFRQVMQPGAAHNLELMKFHHIHRQSVHGIHRSEDTRAVFAGKPVYEMKSHGNSGCGRAPDSVNGIGPRVAAVDDLKRSVACRFSTVFNHHELSIRLYAA